MRILLKDFLHKEALICFITSKKAKRGVVAHNLINRRSIIDEILDQCISDQWSFILHFENSLFFLMFKMFLNISATFTMTYFIDHGLLCWTNTLFILVLRYLMDSKHQIRKDENIFFKNNTKLIVKFICFFTTIILNILI